VSEQLALFDEPQGAQGLIEEFHQVFGCPIDDRDTDVLTTRQVLLKEEFRELQDELSKAWYFLSHNSPIPNWFLEKIAKELADLLYVTYGTGVALGIDLDEVLRRVHQSNMSKLDENGKPIYREDGKVLKGPNYFEPDLSGTYRREDV
jgi:NTP pyrophosphatase (non-canonical NTP hydrolase)